MRAAAIAALVVLTGPALAPAQDLPTPASPPRLAGYIDFGYLATEGPGPDGFLGGRIFGELTHELADRWSVFGEASVRARPDRFDIAVERVYLRFDIDPRMALSVGRFHTPITYWNDTFTRGAWARTSVAPPALAAADGGLLPLHSLGLRAEGRLEAERLVLGYAAGLANGRDLDPARPGDAGDIDGHHAWMLALHAWPGRRSDLRVGGAVYADRPATPTDGDVAERIYTAHLAWERETPELIAEYARIRHDAELRETDLVGRAFYVQLGYRLPDRYRRVKPYLRLEQVDGAEGDPLLRVPPDYRAVVLGARYDVLRDAAVKIEFRSERYDPAERFASLHLQASLRLRTPDAPVRIAVAEPPPGADAEEDAAPRTPEPDTAAAAPERGTPEPRVKGAPRPEPEPTPRPGPVAIVVHPEARVDDLSLPELRRIFRGERESWGDDSRVVLLIRSPLPAERDIVLGRIYQMDETEFRQFWLGRIFRSSVTSGPKMVSDIDTARRLIEALPGAITFMPAAAVGDGLRVVRIDGKLPGEPGYPLQ